ncbi:MAG: hypothetical protein Q7T77_03810 [Sulfuricurvum sp.]|nr:hypothetical protein [Sulfuricurvum sp.]
MAVTLKEISGWLDIEEINHELSDEKIIFGAGDGDNTQAYFIKTKENGDIFDVTMQIVDENQHFVSLKDKEHAGKVLEFILLKNYETKFGTWEYDPADGDVRLSVEIPLEDALMTQKQFNRIIKMMITDGTNTSAKIKHILKTGEIPADDTEAQMLAMFSQMLAMMQASNAASSSDASSESDGI